MVSNEIGKYDYGEDHPMKPERISMVFDLIRNLEFLDKFWICTAKPCSLDDLMVFHDPNYVRFMRDYDSLSTYEKKNHNFNINNHDDVPAFPNFFNFSRLVAGSSIQGANILAQKQADTVVNWMGGLHHAKSNKASGFCYVNDCVLAIKRLLHDFQKVLYIDIDVHHGDGVEAAFLYNPWVLTLSLH